MILILPAVLLWAASAARPTPAARPDPSAGKSSVPTYRCAGFVDPLDKPTLTINRGRTLPLRAILTDAGKKPVLASALKTPPEVRVTAKGKTGSASDLTDAVESRDFGQGFRFVYKEEYWKYDLGTDGVPPGVYDVELVSGSEKHYRVDPRCRLTVTVKESGPPGPKPARIPG